MLIDLQHVEKVYKTRGADVHALRNVDFQAHAGEFVAIVGPSGSGKSTLINMITGIDRPTSGEVYVAGQRLTQMGEDAIARWRGEQIGVVFQFFQLLPTLSVIDNLMMPMRYTNTWRGKRRQRALELLDRVGIPEAADQFPSQLSGEHQQRAAIARALVNDPQILVGDEPTGNLDPASSNRIMALFRELVTQGTTIVMVTHDHDLAGQLPRVVEVRDGRLLSQVDERLVAAAAR